MKIYAPVFALIFCTAPQQMFSAHTKPTQETRESQIVQTIKHAFTHYIVPAGIGAVHVSFLCYTALGFSQFCKKSGFFSYVNSPSKTRFDAFFKSLIYFSFTGLSTIFGAMITAKACKSSLATYNKYLIEGKITVRDWFDHGTPEYYLPESISASSLVGYFLGIIGMNSLFPIKAR